MWLKAMLLLLLLEVFVIVQIDGANIKSLDPGVRAAAILPEGDETESYRHHVLTTVDSMDQIPVLNHNNDTLHGNQSISNLMNNNNLAAFCSNTSEQTNKMTEILAEVAGDRRANITKGIQSENGGTMLQGYSNTGAQQSEIKTESTRDKGNEYVAAKEEFELGKIKSAFQNETSYYSTGIMGMKVTDNTVQDEVIKNGQRELELKGQAQNVTDNYMEHNRQYDEDGRYKQPLGPRSGGDMSSSYKHRHRNLNRFGTGRNQGSNDNKHTMREGKVARPVGNGGGDQNVRIDEQTHEIIKNSLGIMSHLNDNNIVGGKTLNNENNYEHRHQRKIDQGKTHKNSLVKEQRGEEKRIIESVKDKENTGIGYDQISEGEIRSYGNERWQNRKSKRGNGRDIAVVGTDYENEHFIHINPSLTERSIHVHLGVNKKQSREPLKWQMDNDRTNEHIQYERTINRSDKGRISEAYNTNESKVHQVNGNYSGSLRTNHIQGFNKMNEEGPLGFASNHNLHPETIGTYDKPEYLDLGTDVEPYMHAERSEPSEIWERIRIGRGKMEDCEEFERSTAQSASNKLKNDGGSKQCCMKFHDNSQKTDIWGNFGNNNVLLPMDSTSEQDYSAEGIHRRVRLWDNIGPAGALKENEELNTTSGNLSKPSNNFIHKQVNVSDLFKKHGRNFQDSEFMFTSNGKRTDDSHRELINGTSTLNSDTDGTIPREEEKSDGAFMMSDAEYDDLFKEMRSSSISPDDILIERRRNISENVSRTRKRGVMGKYLMKQNITSKSKNLNKPIHHKCKTGNSTVSTSAAEETGNRKTASDKSENLNGNVNLTCETTSDKCSKTGNSTECEDATSLTTGNGTECDKFAPKPGKSTGNLIEKVNDTFKTTNSFDSLSYEYKAEDVNESLSVSSKTENLTGDQNYTTKIGKSTIVDYKSRPINNTRKYGNLVFVDVRLITTPKDNSTQIENYKFATKRGSNLRLEGNGTMKESVRNRRTGKFWKGGEVAEMSKAKEMYRLQRQSNSTAAM